MSIHEQIIALLNGEITTEPQVSELMHVLAVSPEKRSLLIEQIKMSRAFAAMGTGIAPPRSADALLWQGIAGAAAAMPAMTPVATTVALPFLARPFVQSLLAVTLVGLGVGAGWLLGNRDGGTTSATNISPSTASAPFAVVPKVADDSLMALRSELGEISGRYTSALQEIDRLARLSAPAPIVRYVYVKENSSSSRVTRTPSVPVVSDRDISSSEAITTVDIRPATRPHGIPGSSAGDSIGAPAAMPLQASTNPLENLPDEAQWQAGLHDNIRFSLPRIYGLTNPPSVLTDREVFISRKLISGWSFGGALGRTEFHYKIPTVQTGSSDQVISNETAPLLTYGRGFAAMQLSRIDELDMVVSAEAGFGGTTVGLLGTLGISVEYLPSSWFAFHAGISDWTLAVPYNGKLYFGNNLNAYWGAAVRF